MISKVCSSNGLRFFCLAGLISVALTACTHLSPSPELDTERGLPSPEIVDKPDQPTHSPDSRMMASHSLTLEGYEYLKKKDYDGAIRILERAVGINPVDGPGYYYLAEAWLAKKNYNLASRFNDLACLYLRSDDLWFKRAQNQKKRIKHDINGL